MILTDKLGKQYELPEEQVKHSTDKLRPTFPAREVEVNQNYSSPYALPDRSVSLEVDFKTMEQLNHLWIHFENHRVDSPELELPESLAGKMWLVQAPYYINIQCFLLVDHSGKAQILDCTFRKPTVEVPLEELEIIREATAEEVQKYKSKVVLDNLVAQQQYFLNLEGFEGVFTYIGRGLGTWGDTVIFRNFSGVTIQLDIEKVNLSEIREFKNNPYLLDEAGNPVYNGADIY